MLSKKLFQCFFWFSVSIYIGFYSERFIKKESCVLSALSKRKTEIEVTCDVDIYYLQTSTKLIGIIIAVKKKEKLTLSVFFIL